MSASKGQVILCGEPTQDHCNPQGTVHGGYLATMLDSAMALAVQTGLPTLTRFSTTNLNICYFHSVPADGLILHAHGLVVHAGKTIHAAEAKITDTEGKIYAKSQATFSVKLLSI